MFNIKLPQITDKNLTDKEKRIYEYLYALTQELKHYRVATADLDGVLSGTIQGNTNGVAAANKAVREMLEALVGQKQAIVSLADTVDGVAELYFQDEAPTSPNERDVWYDTDADPIKIYKWSGTEWVDITSSTLASALASAAYAQITAESKIYVFSQDGAPTSLSIGDLWIKTNDNNKIYRAAPVGANEITSGEWEPYMVASGYVYTTGVEIDGDDVTLSASGRLNLLGGAEINIATGGKVTIDTPYFIVKKDDIERLVLDEDGNLAVIAGYLYADHISGDIVNSYAGSATITVDGSIQTAIDNLPKHLPYGVTLSIPAGTYTEDININGFFGAMLTLEFSDDVIVNGDWVINDCSSIRLNIASGVTVYPKLVATGTARTVHVFNVGFFRAEYIIISGKARTTSGDGTTNGMQISASHVYINYCDFQKTLDGAYFGVGATGVFAHCTGGVTGSSDATTVAILNYGIILWDGSHINVGGTIPTAALGNTSNPGGTIVGSGTGTQSPYATAPAPPTYTEYASTSYQRMRDVQVRTGTLSYPFTGSISWGSWSHSYWSDWSTNNPRQGISYGGVTLTVNGLVTRTYTQYRYVHYGLWILPTVSDLSSITSASLTIMRDATEGSTGNVIIGIYKHGYTAAQSGHDYSGLADTGLSAYLPRGGSGTVLLDATTLAALKAGTLKGFGLYSSGNYAQLTTSVTLNVTY